MRTNTLRSWIQYRPFSLGDEPDWPRTISVTEPMTREFAVPQRGLTLKLAAGPSISMSLAEIKASAVECIELVFTGDCTLEAAVERAVDIRHLLALLTGRWSQFTELLVVPRDGAPEDDERPHCPVWRPWTVVEDSGGEKDAFCSIPFSSIETSFAQILSTFLSADPRLQQVFAQLLGPWYRPPGYNYSKFLGLTQTAELFHRARFTGKYVDDDKWSPMADRIVASLPANLEPAHWEALKARLRFGNEFSLRKRLRELADSLSGQMADHVVKGTPSVDRIVNARNAVVHGPSADLQLPDGRELIDMVDSLRLLIETLCLLHIGVPQEAVLHGLAERREYLNLRARPNT